MPRFLAFIANISLNTKEHDISFLYTRLNIFVISMILFSSFQTFAGNKDRYTVVAHDLNPPIRTRFLRIVPEEWQSYIALRAEFYGCKTSESY